MSEVALLQQQRRSYISGSLLCTSVTSLWWLLLHAPRHDQKRPGGGGVGVKRSSAIAKGLRAPPVGEFCRQTSASLIYYSIQQQYLTNCFQKHLCGSASVDACIDPTPCRSAGQGNQSFQSRILQRVSQIRTCWLSAWPLCIGDRLKSWGDRLKMLKLPCERGELGSFEWCAAVASRGAISAAASALCGPLCMARGPQHCESVIMLLQLAIKKILRAQPLPSLCCSHIRRECCYIYSWAIVTSASQTCIGKGNGKYTMNHRKQRKTYRDHKGRLGINAEADR